METKLPKEPSELAQKLESLGVMARGSQDVLENLWNHINLRTGRERDNRIAEVIAVQQEYIDQSVFRTREPNRIGKVSHIISDFQGGYKAHVRFGGSRSYIMLSYLEKVVGTGEEVYDESHAQEREPG